MATPKMPNNAGNKTSGRSLAFRWELIKHRPPMPDMSLSPDVVSQSVFLLSGKFTQPCLLHN
jgi:hypothetical protein